MMIKQTIPSTSVGIITFVNADNYGAVLQAYALQHFIQGEITSNVELINFCPEDERFAYRIFAPHSDKFLSNVIIKILVAIHFFSFYKKKKSFRLFRQKYLTCSPAYTDLKTAMELLPGKYDIYISGSDQVFNPYNKYLRLFYLVFPKGNCRKVAYAPSFGVSDYMSSSFQQVVDYLKDFDCLSCREKSGSDWMENQLNRAIPCVLDPVFLLSPSQWKDIMVDSHDRDYIFVYDLNGGYRIQEIAKKLKAVTGLPLIYATPSFMPVFNRKIRKRRDLGPREFVGMIANASYVITDSFHGTAFSVLFSKPMVPFIASSLSSNRIYSLLRLLSLEHLIVTNPNEFDFFRISCIPDYSEVLQRLIEESSLFLKQSLLK